MVNLAVNISNSWKYEHGVCDNDNNDASQFSTKKKLLSRELVNSSHACVNKLFVAINTAKCRTEDIG